MADGDFKLPFDAGRFSSDFIKYIQNNFGFTADANVSPFQGSDVLFQIESPSNKDVYIAKILTEREYKITEYLLQFVDGICASYLALPVEIRQAQIPGISSTVYIMVSPMFGISELSDNLRSDRTQKLKGEEAVFNQFIPGLKRLILFRAAMGLYCLHQHDVIHADVKNDNYFGQNTLLGDFGLSYKEGLTTGRKVINYESLPPFVYNRGKIDYSKINKLADIWGLGMMALQWHTSSETLSETRLFGFAWGEPSLTPATFLNEYYRNASKWIPDNTLRNLINTIFEKTRTGTGDYSMRDVILHPYFEELGRDKDYRYDYEVGTMYVNQTSAAASENKLAGPSVRARVGAKGVRGLASMSQTSGPSANKVNSFAQKKMVLNHKPATSSERARVVESVQRIGAARQARPQKLPGLVEG